VNKVKSTLDNLHLLRFAVKTKSLARTFAEKVRYFQKLQSGKTVVTIFGSCRQDSLYDTFAVTRIREGLTYSHYIEETIQAALYCKDINKKVDFLGAFRVDLLSKSRLNRKALRRDFRATEVFVVEIASLLEYTCEETYIHHEAFDSSLNTSTLENQEIRIKRTRGDVKDVKEKLDKLFQILPRERTVLVSHIATRAGSDRWMLNQTVRRYAAENAIEYFDPSEILQIWPLHQICEVEPVISHFTPMGHEIVRDRLSQCVYRVKNSISQKSSDVVHVYPNSGESIGFGDFVFGSIFLKQLAAERELPVEFNLNGHPLEKMIESQIQRISEEEIVTLYHDDPLSKFKGSGHYVSNRRPRKLDAGDRDFILRTLLKLSQPKSELRTELDTINSLKDSKENLTVFHVRMGDKLSFEEGTLDQTTIELFSQTLQRISKILEYFPITSHYVILSDSLAFREFANLNGFITIINSAAHFNSIHESSSEPLVEMLNEYRLLIGASRIIQFSAYPWGSGFSESAAAIGGAELISFPIQSKS